MKQKRAARCEQPLNDERLLNRSLSKDNLGIGLLSHVKMRSIMGDEALNFRVRNGIGCTRFSMDTKEIFQKYIIDREYERLREKQASRAISIGQLSASQRLHLQPINRIVYPGPSGLATGNTYLKAGFPLRCFQRLSLPYIATLLCSWQNNRFTSGMSIPVLSY